MSARSMGAGGEGGRGHMGVSSADGRRTALNAELGHWEGVHQVQHEVEDEGELRRTKRVCNLKQHGVCKGKRCR